MRASTFYTIYAVIVVALECAALSFAQPGIAAEALENKVNLAPTGAQFIKVADTRGSLLIEPWSCRQLAELSVDQQREAIPLTDLPEVERICALDDGGDCAEYAGSFAGIGALKNSRDDRYCAMIPIAEL